MMRFLAYTVALCGVVSSADVARAATSATFQVAANIQAGCSVDGVGIQGNAGTIGTLDFGQDTSVSKATHTASLTGQAIVLRCTPGVALSMTLDGGQHATSGARNLQLGASASDRLTYRLFRDPSLGQEIGINQAKSIAITSTNMNNVAFPIFGQIVLPGGRKSGTYTDLITVTLSW